MSGSTVASQYFVGLASSLGHSMSSVSSAKRASPRIGETRTLTRAKRDRSFTLVPSRHADLLQRNLRLGLEPDRARNTRLFAASPVVSPFPRQIQPIGDRQAGMMVGDRQRHRHLTIGLLAELPAVLMMDPDRMRPFLGKPCLVDDPDFDPAALRHRRHHL